MKTQKQIQDEWAYETMLHSTVQALLHEIPIANIQKIAGGLMITTASGHIYKMKIEPLDNGAVDSLISKSGV